MANGRYDPDLHIGLCYCFGQPYSNHPIVAFQLGARYHDTAFPFGAWTFKQNQIFTLKAN